MAMDTLCFIYGASHVWNLRPPIFAYNSVISIYIMIFVKNNHCLNGLIHHRNRSSDMEVVIVGLTDE